MPEVEIRGLIALSLPVSLIQRLEAQAPASQRMRSAFVRAAVERALDEAERDQDREPEPAGAEA
jgi:metal-responsive CopG/Arc/MetJ family transcriptional regulator